MGKRATLSEQAGRREGALALGVKQAKGLALGGKRAKGRATGFGRYVRGCARGGRAA